MFFFFSTTILPSLSLSLTHTTHSLFKKSNKAKKKKARKNIIWLQQFHVIKITNSKFIFQFFCSSGKKKTIKNGTYTQNTSFFYFPLFTSLYLTSPFAVYNCCFSNNRDLKDKKILWCVSCSETKKKEKKANSNLIILPLFLYTDLFIVHLSSF